ncbi:MAG: ABC transporter ATP-binding protein [Chloroflexota bacterium]
MDLDVARGEVVALLGPSGSGKTTLLHAAAGFVLPTDGAIAIAGQEVSRRGWALPPEKRSVGLVFQNYALWPHMTALETVAYPLERRGERQKDAYSAAQDWLERVGLGDLSQRRPRELSGGEQQRVGLARALASNPRLFLFDEPTANLDARLKASLQQEIARQQRSTGAGALYVTHDPAEALAVADRVAVLRAGRLIQVADPVALYAEPADAWVASLTGPCSTFPVATARTGPDGCLQLSLLGEEVRCEGLVSAANGQRRLAILRPEWAEMGPAGASGLGAEVAAVRFQGGYTDYLLRSHDHPVTVRHYDPPRYRVNDRVSWRPKRLIVVADTAAC